MNNFVSILFYSNTVLYTKKYFLFKTKYDSVRFIICKCDNKSSTR